jgi:CDP-glycerol glycerophosphotransferase
VCSGDELRAVTLYATKPNGNFTLDIGERKHEVLPT